MKRRILGLALLCALQMYAGDCEQPLKLQAEIKQLERRIETASAQFALMVSSYRRRVYMTKPSWHERDLTYSEVKLAYWAYACKEIKERKRDLYSILDIPNMDSTEEWRVDIEAVNERPYVVCAECKNDWQIICNRIRNQ